MVDTEQIDVPSQGNERVTLQRCGPLDLFPILDWLECHLRHDYFFKRGHLAGILRRDFNKVFWIRVAGEPAGVVVIYKDTTLHNLYLSPECRGRGVGTAIMRFLRPHAIRAKTNMHDGDPVPFYQRCGYAVAGADPARPWIVEMRNMQANNAPTPLVAALAATPGTASAPPTSLTISGPLLQQFRKYVKWQLASKAKNEERKALKKQLDAQRGLAYISGPPGFYFDGKQWVQGSAPVQAALPGQFDPVPGTLTSLEDAAGMFGDGAQ